MKRIMIVVPSLGIGGQERVAINTVKSLKGKYDVSMTVFQSKEVEYDHICRVHNLNLPANDNPAIRILRQIKRAVKLAQLCKKEKIDCVYSFGTTANLTNVLSKLISHKKTIIAIHGFREIGKSRLFSYILRHADKTICISREMQYQLLKLYPKLSNTIVIENGYDISMFEEKKPNSIDLYNEPLKIISMGRLTEVKGFDRLIKAFAVIHKKIPNSVLSIMGEGEIKQDLTELAKKEGVLTAVRFLGYVEYPVEELRKHDIYILSSHNEGFPNALIEALGSGLAVISVDCLSGPREILSKSYSPQSIQGIIYEKYGILVENSSDEKVITLLSQATIELFNAPENLKHYRALGFERSKCFSIQRYGEKVIELLRSL